MENRSKRAKSADSNFKAMGKGERTSKKVSTIRTASGTSFRRKNANQYGAAEGGNDYTEKRVNRTDSFETGGTADSAENGGANVGGTLGSSMMKRGGAIYSTTMKTPEGNIVGKIVYNDLYKTYQVNIDGSIYGEFKTKKEAMEDLKNAGFGKMANGGGLANVPESFPETDAMSYKKGGSTRVVNEYRLAFRNDKGKIIYRDSEGVSVGDAYNVGKWREGIENDGFKFIPTLTKVIEANKYEYKTNEMAQGGSTKGFEYSIGGL
jgi:hypothetical protein